MSTQLLSQRFLEALRSHMSLHNLTAVVVPTSDPHNSEYVADRFAYRAKLTNFYGSAGTAVVTQKEALLWTDGRYWLEAGKSLSPAWTLQKSGVAGVPTFEEWLETENDKHKQKLKENTLSTPSSFNVGVDTYTFSLKAWEALSKKVALVPSNAVRAAAEEAIGDAAPPQLFSSIFVRSEAYCGATPSEKVEAVLKAIATASPPLTGAPLDAVLLTALDDIAWLTNLRGLSDVPYNPVFISYAVIDVGTRAVHLFVDFVDASNACGASSPPRPPLAGIANRTSVAAHCAAHSITIHPYSAIEEFLQSHYIAANKVVGIEEGQTNYALARLFIEAKASAKKKASTSSATSGETAPPLYYKRIPSFVSNLKGTKNDVELKGFEDCHVRDGVALTRFMAWLTEAMTEAEGPKAEIRETDCCDKLDAFRAAEALYHGPSFATISSSGPNGAVIHYHPQRPTDPAAPLYRDRALSRDELYLVDSGGQYEDGTTDVTRVLTFYDPHSKVTDKGDEDGDGKEEEKKAKKAALDALFNAQRTAYTLVLKGHVALAEAVFPQGVAGYRLDCLARQFLWREGLDYAHGTGHGVGSFLCVHEGPHSCPARLPATAVPLVKGMIMSNEPGYYEDGSYGIRIENLVAVVEAAPAAAQLGVGMRAAAAAAAVAAAGNNNKASSSSTSLSFKQLTQVPFNRDLIDTSLLTEGEKAFINRYHAEVRAALEGGIAAHGDERAMKYLLRHTEPFQ